MVFFGAAELPFDGFFALFVFCFSLGGVAVVFRDVQGVLPEVASDGFLMVFAGGATVKGRTVFADFWIAFVFAVSFTCRGAVGEDGFFRAEVAVVVGVVDEVAFVVGVVEGRFVFGPGVGEDGQDVFFKEGFGDGRGFVAGVHDEFFRF